jgi:hypothetical protein
MRGKRATGRRAVMTCGMAATGGSGGAGTDGPTTKRDEGREGDGRRGRKGLGRRRGRGGENIPPQAARCAGATGVVSGEGDGEIAGSALVPVSCGEIWEGAGEESRRRVVRAEYRVVRASSPLADSFGMMKAAEKENHKAE